MPGFRSPWPFIGTRAAPLHARPEILLKTAIESTPNGLCIFDADLRVVVSNSRFAEMYGLTPAQTRPETPLREILDSRVAASYCPSNAAEYVAGCLSKAASRQMLETTNELRNGNIIAVSRHPMLDGGLIEVHRDITDARLAEARAEAARQELIEKQYAIDQAVIVAVTDVEGRITYANDNFCKISGYSREELLGQDHRILNSGTHSKAFFREMYRCIGSGEVWRGELCNKSKSGSLYWVDTVITPQLGVNGKAIAYMAIRIDITARRHAEAQIAYAATHDFADRIGKPSGPPGEDERSVGSHPAAARRADRPYARSRWLQASQRYAGACCRRRSAQGAGASFEIVRFVRPISWRDSAVMNLRSSKPTRRIRGRMPSSWRSGCWNWWQSRFASMDRMYS